MPSWRILFEDTNRASRRPITAARCTAVSHSSFDAVSTPRSEALGFISGSWVELDAHQTGRLGITVAGAPRHHLHQSPSRNSAAASKAAAAGQLVPVHAPSRWKRAAEAHEPLQGRGNVGPLLITRADTVLFASSSSDLARAR
ncbi:hypothetical protein F1D05_34660 [Kribbella qitaiheensis]|uniref:Uncharacterized protein n=1 Tax=Kribbella qitaiheensis TaxID=1544730 RepID=A0A7G6X799_9ACTN|nr:hypothetical protein [Kribbella qitaiheensis]QNE22114.1 hypothetical protein F1D05_34660 [Kribbella qitaiheensis]